MLCRPLTSAVMIGTLDQSLIRMNISEFVKDALLGLFILLGVASDALILNRLRDLWARGSGDLQVTGEKQDSHESAKGSGAHAEKS